MSRKVYGLFGSTYEGSFLCVASHNKQRLLSEMKKFEDYAKQEPKMEDFFDEEEVTLLFKDGEKANLYWRAYDKWKAKEPEHYMTCVDEGFYVKELSMI